MRNEGNQLIAEASQRKHGRRLQCFVQAIVAVNDMLMLAQPRVATFFWEDVQAFLDQHGIRYSPCQIITSESGFDRASEFLIPISRTRPERIVRVLHAPNRHSLGTKLFTLGDLRQVCGRNSAYTFLNDLFLND